MAIINYRVDHKPGELYPYELIRYGAFKDTCIQNFEDRHFIEADDALGLLRREAPEIQQLERIDTLNQIRREIYDLMPMLDAVKQADGNPTRLSLTAAFEEIRARLNAGSGIDKS